MDNPDAPPPDPRAFASRADYVAAGLAATRPLRSAQTHAKSIP